MHFRNMSPIEVPQCFIIKLTNIILCLRFSRICKCRTASNQWRSGVKNAIPALHRLLKALSMTLVMQIWYMQCYSLERLFFFFFLPKYCLQKKLRSSESKCAHICTDDFVLEVKLLEHRMWLLGEYTLGKTGVFIPPFLKFIFFL